MPAPTSEPADTVDVVDPIDAGAESAPAAGAGTADEVPAASPVAHSTPWHPVSVAAGVTALLGCGAGAGAMTYRGARAQQARIAAARAEFFGPATGP